MINYRVIAFIQCHVKEKGIDFGRRDETQETFILMRKGLKVFLPNNASHTLVSICEQREESPFRFHIVEIIVVSLITTDILTLFVYLYEYCHTECVISSRPSFIHTSLLNQSSSSYVLCVFVYVSFVMIFFCCWFDEWTDVHIQKSSVRIIDYKTADKNHIFVSSRWHRI